MMFLYLCLFAVGYAVTAKTITKDFPLNVCHQSDPEINTCLLQQAGPILKKLKNGIPKFGIKPIDPFKLDFMSAEGDLEFVKFKIVMKNITVFGNSEAIFSHIKYDPKSQSGDISFIIPNIRTTCVYFATGRLFVIPLESSAHFDGNFTGINVNTSFRLNTVEKKGKEYFTIDKLALKVRVETSHIKLISVNPENQQQVNVIQDFCNENYRLVLDTIIPFANQYGSEMSKHMLESYIRRIPADELLPK